MSVSAKEVNNDTFADLETLHGEEDRNCSAPLLNDGGISSEKVLGMTVRFYSYSTQLK